MAKRKRCIRNVSARKEFQSSFDFYRKVEYILINIPATPLGFRVYAHFGQVFSFIASVQEGRLV